MKTNRHVDVIDSYGIPFLVFLSVVIAVADMIFSLGMPWYWIISPLWIVAAIYVSYMLIVAATHILAMFLIALAAFTDSIFNSFKK